MGKNSYKNLIFTLQLKFQCFFKYGESILDVWAVCWLVIYARICCSGVSVP
ncbi:hypothetical protein HanPI659440_Chr02g0089921 [Helianthus annuus]|nr:hypothetical protein HanIR_Chr02g0094741 [Helianthus annuus]KAJ0806479.1 hypothetical protein HanPI659440_Chr02g0089921 [Helianthus annuus]